MYYQKYISRWKNTEDQEVIVRIEDRLSELINPYNISYTVEDAGGGMQDVVFTYNTIAGASGIRLEYSADGGATYTNAGVETPGSPTSWNIPTGNYVYLFIIEFTDPMADDEVIVVEELEGITDELEASGDPLHLIVNSNGQSKLPNAIKGMQAVFQFNSDTNNNIGKLLRGPYSDKRYYMTIAINDELNIIFRGFVSMGDMKEPFLPHSNVCTITATDGLGGLRNVTLKDFTNAVPKGYHRIIDFVAWCLRFTGIEENINIVMNFREENNPDDHWYLSQYLESKTFETEVDERQDCYTVLSNIHKNIGFIGQRLGEWWVKAIDHFDTADDLVAVFNSAGEFQELREPASFIKEIGHELAMGWAQGGGVVSFKGPATFGKETYYYNLPKEIPCNVDFVRGDYIGQPDPTGEPGWKTYELDCWTLKGGTPGTPTTPDSEVFISRKFDTNDNEIERYAEITFPTYPGSNCYLQHEPILIEKGDKFDFWFDFRFSSNFNPGGTINITMARVWLLGDDGTVWIYSDNNNGWQLSNINWSVNDEQLSMSWDSSAVDETEWRTFNMSSNWSDSRNFREAPVDGKLYICPLWGNVNALQGYSLNISNFRIELYPKLNGIFQKIKGQYHKVSQSAYNNESYDEEVFLSDSPKRIFKGALHYKDGSNYYLSGRVYNAQVFPGGVPADEFLHPFAYTMAQASWNQVRLLNRIFTGTIDGIESSSLDVLGRCDVPTIFHTYKLRDLDEHTTDRLFVCVGYDMDLFLCEWRPEFVEVLDIARGKKYNDTYEFKMITE